MACALRCPRRYYYDNIIGLKVATSAEALRIGSAVHNGGEARANGACFEEQYTAAITGTQLDEWMAAKVFGILGAYCRTYGETADRDYIAMNPEVEFVEAIDGSRTFEQRGKVDGLAVLTDGRRVVWERKTTSDDLAETSDYWQRLKFNPQLLAYGNWVYNTTGELPVCVYGGLPAVRPQRRVRRRRHGIGRADCRPHFRYDKEKLLPRGPVLLFRQGNGRKRRQKGLENEIVEDTVHPAADCDNSGRIRAPHRSCVLLRPHGERGAFRAVDEIPFRAEDEHG